MSVLPSPVATSSRRFFREHMGLFRRPKALALTAELPRDVAEIGVRLLDTAHMTWVAAAIECEYAFHAWLDGGPSERSSAYLSYRAALDREEAAALDLQRLSALARPCEERLGSTETRRGSVKSRFTRKRFHAWV